jgi:hypothetical protein
MRDRGDEIERFGQDKIEELARQAKAAEAKAEAEAKAAEAGGPAATDHINGNGFDEASARFEESWRGSAAPAPETGRFPLTRFRDIPFSKTARYVIKGLLPDFGMVLVWGEPKCGKSFWTFDMLMHVALGWQYRGRRVHQGTVVYRALEGNKGFENRKEAFRQVRLADSPDADPPFYLMSSPLKMIAEHAILIASIRAEIGDQKRAVVCIDTLNRSLDGSESSDEDMAAYIRAGDAVRDAFDCCVVIVHHCGHTATGRPRGHSSIIGALDVMVAVKREENKDIVCELEAAKDLPSGAKLVSKLKPVELIFNSGGHFSLCKSLISFVWVENFAKM